MGGVSRPQSPALVGDTVSSPQSQAISHNEQPKNISIEMSVWSGHSNLYFCSATQRLAVARSLLQLLVQGRGGYGGVTQRGARDGALQITKPHESGSFRKVGTFLVLVFYCLYYTIPGILPSFLEQQLLLPCCIWCHVESCHHVSTTYLRTA